MPYKRKKKNRSEWVADVMRQGKRYFGVFKTRSQALQFEASIRAIPENELQTLSTSLSLIDWVNEYLEFCQSRFVQKTFDEKRYCFNRFFKAFGPADPVDSLNSWKVLKYLQDQAKTRSGYSVNKDRKNLVAAWNWGMKYMGLPTPNPCLVEPFPEKRHPRYIPPEKDFWTIYECAEGQDKVMLLAYLHLAARKSELFRLTWDDVDFGQQTVRLGTRKRRGGNMEYESIPMTDELYDALLAHKQGSQCEYVFPDPETGQPYMYRIHFMKQLCKRAGVRKFGFHAIRHLTASILAQANVPMITIQAILRHKNLSTTEKYVRGLEPVRPALRVLSHRNPRSRPKVPTSALSLAQMKKGAA